MIAPELSREARRQLILKAQSLDRLLDEAGGEAVLRAEAAEPNDDIKLISAEQLEFLLALRAERRKAAAKPQLSFTSEDVIIVPGLLGSSLTDVRGPNGLIWIDPTLVVDGAQLSALRLDSFHENEPEADAAGALIEATGAIPAQYDLLSLYLRFWRYAPTIFPFDWRKDIEAAARALADLLRARLGQPPRPLHLIAHSQGSLVARRGLQLLGVDNARKLVDNLVLLGPASYGSFSAAEALSGNSDSLDMLRRFGVKAPADFPKVLQSFTGLYQLLPWNPDTAENGFDPSLFANVGHWTNEIDEARLSYGFGWAARIDTTFFNDRTTIILGERAMKGAARFEDGRVVVDGPDVSGDGTITDKNACLKDVRTYRMPGGIHASLPLYPTVQTAIRAILKDESPALKAVVLPLGAAAAHEPPIRELLVAEKKPTPAAPKGPKKALAAPKAHQESPSLGRPQPPAPPCRKLRVFSFDPLLSTNLDALAIAVLDLNLPWDEALVPGPIGEYVEVVDYDPASRRFYHPVDLSDPRVIAQHGLKPSESNPQFHQQMVYGVAMSTITAFEKALGRVALWAPRLERNSAGNVISKRNEDSFVPRLRIYPHAFRDANAYYDPEHHAILFGYFSSREQPGGETIPGGTVFTCLSFDIIAHETTHALLHGLHRYYLYPSNMDMLAFHEAFADAVALFQNFAHIDVVEHQIARTRGNLRAENLLGQLARQFAAAMGEHRGALRQYIDVKPDSSLLQTTDEPHDRGAVLMAALFKAFLNIYDNRTKDLYRIATNGTGKLPDGDIHPDLVRRLATEASKSARHMLTMCVRALDYVPAVDLTFGEYLRALITADYDIVRDDDLGYRVSVLDAFRSWGIYPADVNVLDEAAVLWDPPEPVSADALRTVVALLDLSGWSAKPDRRAVHGRMNANGLLLRKWLFQNARDSADGTSLGVMIFGSGYHSIPRNERNTPKFEVHSVRPCLRIGPDGQQRKDLVVEIVQRRAGYFSRDDQEKVDSAKKPWAFSDQEAADLKRPRAADPDFWFRGGCTLIVEPESGVVRYSIRKSILNDERLDRQRGFERGGGHFSLAATYFGTQDRNPFALLHGDEAEQIYGS